MLLNPPDGDWLMWRRTYDGWGYSPLDQINKENVGDLELAWAWGMTPGGGRRRPRWSMTGSCTSRTPTHLIQALDAATGELIWEYQYELPEDVNPSGERNKAIYGDKLIIATRDAHLIALDTKTGQLVWDQQVANYKHGCAYSSGPIVANGVIVQGMTSCGNAQPGGCFFTGHDPDTGEELWRVNTIARGDTPEGNSWNGVPLESRHGASAWIAGSYDPEQNLIFAGVGQPYPWNVEIAGLTPASSDPNVTNEALYTNSTLAIDPTTGELKWYHQYLPTDSLDLDYVYERMLIDLPVDGEDAQDGGDDRQARHHRVARPDHRRMAVGQGDGAAERGAFDRSGNRREGDQPGGDSGHRRDHLQLPGRPGRAAPGRPRPTARGPRRSICRRWSSARTPR